MTLKRPPSASAPFASLHRNREPHTADEPKTAMAIVASRTCPVSQDVISKVLSVIGTIGDHGVINVRAPGMETRTSAIEELVWELGSSAGIRVDSWIPYGDPGTANLYRDRQLVSSSPSGVVAFFPVDEVMNGGTGHVVHAALDAGIPVEVYGVDTDGSVGLLGSLDGAHTDPIFIAGDIA
jgi:hypothetical protein